MQLWNQVQTTVFVDGTPCPFTTLRLEQRFNDHHFFDIGILCSPLPGKGVWHYERESVIAKQGQQVSIRMKHEMSGDETIFRGFITEIEMSADDIIAGMIHYKGYSSTYLLESGKTMDSFTNYTLAEIASEVVRNYGNGVTAVIAPKFYDRISYLQMQNESGYEFLRRIAYQYGEWFYYDGMKLYFGNPYIDKEETVTYNVELESVSYKSHITPFNSSRHDFLYAYDQQLHSDDSRTVKGINTYLYEAINASNSVYQSHTTRYNEAVNSHPIHLSHLMDMEKGREIAGMSLLVGKSNTCRIRLAHPLVVKIPATLCTRRDLGRYRITSVIHQIDSNGIYSNTFEGVPCSMEHIPVDNITLPQATPMLGWVVGNADPQGWGRVQVQFAWQQERNKSTDWIRVGSPDGGKSEAGANDRGFIFVPEIGDQVMVCFEGGNPSRPYVQTSLFRTNYPRKGQVDNQIKTISTRGGHLLEFNDKKEGGWGITVKDQEGNVIHMDTKGRNIEISSPETLTLKGKNVRIEAEENIEILARKIIELLSEKDINIFAKENLSQQANGNQEFLAGGNMSLEAASEFSSAGKTVLVEGSSDVSISGKKIEISGSKTTIQGSSNKVELD